MQPGKLAVRVADNGQQFLADVTAASQFGQVSRVGGVLERVERLDAVQIVKEPGVRGKHAQALMLGCQQVPQERDLFT